MKACEALIAWTPGTDLIRVGPLIEDGQADWTEYPIRYAYTGGAAYIAVRKLKGAAAALRVFVDFNTIVVRDGVSPAAANKAFLAIDEYRKLIAPDMEGADE